MIRAKQMLDLYHFDFPPVIIQNTGDEHLLKGLRILPWNH